MAQPGLLRLVPDASPSLCDMLDPARGAVQPPIRAEIFGMERFAQHGRSLGEAHRAAPATARTATFFPRLRSNIQRLREASQYLGAQAGSGYDVSPATEWLLDNAHVIEAQLKEIHEGLPRRYFRTLPTLIDPPLAGLPRVYGVAWAFVAHTDGAFDEELLTKFLGAYQETRELHLCEMWSLPTTLRVVLVENLRRLAEREATHKAAREVANLCGDRITAYTLQTLDQLVALLSQRGVERVFLAQMAQRLQARRTADHTLYQEWVRNALPDLAPQQAQQAIDQTADNLSVSNAVTSLRAIGAAEWPDIVAGTNRLMRLMLTSPVFEAEDGPTRDLTLHGIERLARLSGRSEAVVGQTLLDLMRGADSAGSAAAVASHWLRGAGRATLVRALDLPARAALSWRGVGRRVALPVYLAAMVFGAVGLVAWLLLRYPAAGPAGADAPTWLTLLGAALLMFPASEAVLAMIHRLISESVPPDHLPRLALAEGIPPEHRVLVVIPGMLTDPASTDALVHRLRLHYLANPERHAQFALLTDWADADAAQLPSDEDLLARALQQVRDLNTRHPREPQELDAAPRFIVLHRPREFCETEQRWIGWERKRGKLAALCAALADGASSAFLDLGELSRLAADTPYVVTLDSDTQLPPGRLRELVSVAAHPHNQPRLDASGRVVVGGYGILQPRLVTPLPAPREFTLYHWLFAGQSGIDPYSAASSEVYQDVFGEGSFTGKGLLHARAMHAVLGGGRLPEGRVLSHDLFEGALARCAAVTDITVIEDAPFHADVAASRVHRWTRGDWQLLPFLLSLARFRVSTINRWKMSDNLRRSLVAPASLALLVLALAGAVVSPWAALALVLAAFSAGPLLGALAGLAPARDDVARERFYRQALADLARALWVGLWHLSQLLQQALLSLDAIGRALYRMTISHRHLLQWTTSAAAQAQAKTRLVTVARQHWKEPVLALGLLVVLLAAGSPWPALAVTLCALWAAAPVGTWWASRPRPVHKAAGLPRPDHDYLECVARDTWRLFERCVGPEDHHLPPDNLQTSPHEMVAHRTSPTNIGLYLLSVACARQFGWIGTQELLERLDATLATLATLQRHRGHFLNWYDTQTCEPLLPMYVSTVDSGNLSGHLLAVGQACLARAAAPHEAGAARQAIHASRQRLDRWHDLLPSLRGDTALARLLALPDPLDAGQRDGAAFERLLREAGEQMAALVADRGEPLALAMAGPHGEGAWCLADHLAMLRSAWRDLQADTPAGAQRAAQHLQTLAHTCGLLAWDADFSFLYHPRRHLLHIGYRVAEQQLDASFYDLLASESRLTSLLAIAKGDVPVSHWATLGRPFYACGTHAGLRSWAGSMFEYLMPSLVLDEPPGSVLHEACAVALHEHIAFGTAQGVPWGLSESAYAGRDDTLAYQYAAQGVPRLALRRTPSDELVVAPYATALAALVAPHRARGNFAALEDLAGRARYGFVEAIDFSPARQAGGQLSTPVRTFMAHHQGMSIVALANVLLDGAPRRWGMANPHIEAVTSLLHERAPRELSRLYAPPSAPLPQVLQRHAPRMLRDVLPGAAALEPTHMLSNGRYSVTLRANGAGWSRWGPTALTRWRDDALRDDHGSFFYLRRLPAGEAARVRPVSLTQHPAPDPSAHYQSTFHEDRLSFDAGWSDLAAHITVWVSPEDDIEFREVELRNLGEEALDLELMSAFEVALAEPRADEAHPAFTSLFVRAEWQPLHQALVFERKPRLPTEPSVRMAHFLAVSDPQVVDVSGQADRQRWRGRNQAVSEPLAAFTPMLAASTDPAARDDGSQDIALDTGLDPVCALSVRLRVAPGAKALLTFATAASDHGPTLHAVIDKYRQHSHVQRASLMSATLTRIRLDTMRLSAENFAAIQTLTTALVLSLTRPQAGPARGEDAVLEVCDRRLLWRLGISGDRPVIGVSVSVMQHLGLLRALAQALRLWSWGGIACDLVVVNAELASYEMALQREIGALRERHEADRGVPPGVPSSAGFYVVRADELGPDDLSTLQSLARLWLQADGRPLLQHLREWTALHEQDFEVRHDSSSAAVAVAAAPAAPVPPPAGEFAPVSGEFHFEASARLRPVRPWANVLANPGFGALLTEAGGGYSWAVNSRMNQLTAWSNDPVADPPAEWFLLQDLRTRRAWSVAPSAWGDGGAAYRVTHGQGYSVISHRRGDLEVTASWCVDAQTSIKQVSLRLVHRGAGTLRLRVVALVEWMMGASRVDRNTVHTAPLHQRLPTEAPPGADAARGARLTALLCTQRERSAGFGNGTAFLAIAGAADPSEDWTCDRREFFDARGRLVLPDHFGQRSGSGLDPCAALSAPVELRPGDVVERVFLLGYADHPDAARQLATLAVVTTAAQRLHEVRSGWDRLLGATTVKTPDPLFDAMVNRWLLYQTVVCRLWAKGAFYQAGGATGFRDQLQDAMALAWADPARLRQQIVLCASRQFVEGDVQHWWHLPGGAGVRTHMSDDLLWLPHACVHYLRATADATLLDQDVPFLEGPAIPEHAEDSYHTPRVSDQAASVYEHGARALDRSLQVGAHGLPLMGGGDWNDGMNRVGHEGRGESVWLGWFLCRLVADFAPLARARGDEARAERWEIAAQGWQDALNGTAWDGQWFKRAFFDDGQPLGSQANAEGAIDLIAQAWSVLSGAAEPDLARRAMAAAQAYLVDPEAGLIRLLDPPFEHALPSAGYIQAYPPGVRENGGQYTHAGVWALMAQAALARRPDDGQEEGGAEEGGDRVYRYFSYLSPAHRASHPTRGPVYGLEPYVVAGDVYSQPPVVGRGGWSWYTGAAGWLHRAAVESMFGLQLGAQTLSFAPCLPTDWPQAVLILRRGGRRMRFILVRATPKAARAAAASLGVQVLRPGQPLAWPDLGPDSCFVIPLLGEPAPPVPDAVA